jgi:hypothetical protein
MRIMHWVAFITGIALIIARGFWSELFVVDVFSVVILFILFIPFVAQYLRKAKFPGAEFEFKDEIRETEKLVKLSVEQAEKLDSTGEKKILPFVTFKLSAVKEILDSDPILALAALRIEIERKLRLLVNTLDLPIRSESSVSRLIEAVKKQELLTLEQVNALQKIVSMCNKAIHGSVISDEEARRIIDLAEELNRTFSIGYSIDYSPNLDFEKHRLLCEWEHCIEWMPLTEERTEISCPVFGHNCPGGVEKVSVCEKQITDIPKSRFIKK